MVTYLDNAASTPIDERVLAAMLPWLTAEYANPSSRHRPGVRAREAIERARAQVARAAGARASQVLFTSGGTEANNLGVLGAARARARHGRHVLVGSTEHPSVRAPCEALAREGFEVETLRLSSDGALDLEHLASRLRKDTVLVAQMMVQNEVGTVYPVAEVARAVRARAPHASLHVDAVQAFGKHEISLESLGATTLALSSHKVHGPKGMGALVTAPGAVLESLVHGGGQERDLRPGTENVPGIVGFGLAAELCESSRSATVARLEALRRRFVQGLERVPGARVIEPGSARQVPTPAIVALLVPGLPGEARMNHLEALDVVVSAGSACHAGKKDVSPSLRALDLSVDDARSFLRVSFSRMTTEADVDAALDALARTSADLARSSS